MSLGIAFKGPEGIVLAADSRVTLMAITQGNPAVPGLPQQVVLPATFDNATKLLQITSQPYVGAVTYGAGAMGQREPRTASSFLPEFDRELTKDQPARLTVEDFAKRLGDFFMRQWTASGMPDKVPPGNDMVFLVGGYDPDAAYGRIFEIFVPNKPVPNEMIAGQFGAAWGGQREITDRIIQGFDPQLPAMVQDILKIPPEQRDPTLENQLKAKLSVPIPWQFLPLQDCVDLSIFLVKTTVTLQKWLVAIRGVGGMVDVATITRTEGFKPVQQKQISGERASYLPGGLT
ncbi:MAG: hypothetical protein ABSD47_20875 [Candidatus Methylomirabilota bacterium]|jgi:hypothetical protein